MGKYSKFRKRATILRGLNHKKKAQEEAEMAFMMERTARGLATAILMVCLGGVPLFLTVAGMTASAQEPTGAAPGSGVAAAEPEAGPEVVTIGAYLNDVQAIDFKNHNYMVDFYLWFRWKNPEIDPSSTLEFVNHSESWGTIITKAYENPEILPDGQRYQIMHIEGRMSHKFNLRHYPFDRQGITIEMEDAVMDVSGLTFKVERVSANPALRLPGFDYEAPTMQVHDYRYPTNFGDTRVANSDAYSRVRIDLRISRPTVNAIVKNVLPMLLATICASFVFLLHPSLVDTRFQIAIFSIFTIVALQITQGDDLPTIEYLTLLDILYLLSYLYCIAIIGLLVYATKLSRSETRMDAAIKLDRWGGGLLFGAYLIISGAVIFSVVTT
ncbi:hypothetical protein CCR95_02360 [Thiocystis minor]|uniref:hypothetical protein n=1 Tax=Thiocystis minor TaxID=61597 RepID=UPI001914AE3C|nr:hypothetical protein [Thiocystis minor]MBK5962963.1 hypothetical protein [Thiocystis minor]